MTGTERLAWRTSTRSSNGEKCVEVAPTATGVIMRHSKHHTSGEIAFSYPAWVAFVREACGQRADVNGVATMTKIGTDTLVEALHSRVQLRFDGGEWSAFVAGAADGEFDFADPRVVTA